MDNISTLSTFAATSFALMNPLGMLPLFIAYANQLDSGAQRWLAILLAGTVFGLTLLFLLTGNAILHFFGISLDSFRIAGGVLLLIIGIHIVLGNSSKTAQELAVGVKTNDFGEAKAVYRQIVVPMAMPLLVGPGLIANLILYAGEAHGEHDTMLTMGLAGVLFLLSVLTAIILSSGQFLRHALGDVGLTIMTRVLGLLVAAIGMQFIITGGSNVIIQDIAPAILKLH
ncbi:MAG: MarC family protein [Halothiobacillaceae bacterium]